jgi:hypothetical protein
MLLTAQPDARRWAMRTALLSIIAAGLLAAPGRAADVPAIPKPAGLWEAASAIRDRLVGLAIASRLRPGMTTAETDQIMGNLLVDEGQTNPFGLGMWWGFRRYGFSVSYALDKDGQMRLVRVEVYSPFGR